MLVPQRTAFKIAFGEGSDPAYIHVRIVGMDVCASWAFLIRQESMSVRAGLVVNVSPQHCVNSVKYLTSDQVSWVPSVVSTSFLELVQCPGTDGKPKWGWRSWHYWWSCFSAFYWAIIFMQRRTEWCFPPCWYLWQFPLTYECLFD